MRALALVGFMGSGKSTVGAILAGRLGVPFLDLDSHLERTHGETVAEQFSSHGEEEFRQREHAALMELALQGFVGVLALGGGTLMNPESRRALGEFADVVWLDVPFGLAAARIEAQGRHTRPLASGDDWEHKLAALYARRAPLYASAAAWAVDGRGCPEEVAGRITALLEAGAGRRNE